jgi:hypothetical protein
MKPKAFFYNCPALLFLLRPDQSRLKKFPLKETPAEKQKGEKIERVKEPSRTNVVNLMDALRKSVAEERKPAAKTKKGRKRIAGQSEMLLPIQGGSGKATAAKPVTKSRAKQKKAG